MARGGDTIILSQDKRMWEAHDARTPPTATPPAGWLPPSSAPGQLSSTTTPTCPTWSSSLAPAPAASPAAWCLATSPRTAGRSATTTATSCWSATRACAAAPATYWPPCSTKPATAWPPPRSEEHTSELQSRRDLVCRLLLEKKKKT